MEISPLQPIWHHRVAHLVAAALLSICLIAFLVAVIPSRLQTPVHASSKQAQAAGAAVFQERGCQHCHGADATGTDRGPDLSAVGKRWKKDHIEQQIRNGGGGMPAFGDVLQTDEVRSLVDYLSAKRKSQRRSRIPTDKAKPVVPTPASNDDSGMYSTQISPR